MSVDFDNGCRPIGVVEVNVKLNDEEIVFIYSVTVCSSSPVMV
jgi:hypothetical protein